MKKKVSLCVAGFVAMFAFTGCYSSKNLYSWYGYEKASYAYSKTRTPEREQNLIETYEKIIRKQKGARNVVPPGIYAEYGYLLVKKGKVEEGIRMMANEINNYPESEVFVSRIIKQLQK